MQRARLQVTAIASTFDPHSSPAGICYLGNDFPADYRGGFFVVRFGNLLARPRDVGFDLLLVQPTPPAGDTRSARITRVLGGLGRPIDVLVAGPGRVLIAEYARSTDNSGAGGMLPGRILELRVTP